MKCTTTDPGDTDAWITDRMLGDLDRPLPSDDREVPHDDEEYR